MWNHNQYTVMLIVSVKSSIRIIRTRVWGWCGGGGSYAPGVWGRCGKDGCELGLPQNMAIIRIWNSRSSFLCSASNFIRFSSISKNILSLLFWESTSFTTIFIIDSILSCLDHFPVFPLIPEDVLLGCSCSSSVVTVDDEVVWLLPVMSHISLSSV